MKITISLAQLNVFFLVIRIKILPKSNQRLNKLLKRGQILSSFLKCGTPAMI